MCESLVNITTSVILILSLVLLILIDTLVSVVGITCMGITMLYHCFKLPCRHVKRGQAYYWLIGQACYVGQRSTAAAQRGA